MDNNHIHVLAPNNVYTYSCGTKVELNVLSCIDENCGYWEWIMDDESIEETENNDLDCSDFSDVEMDENIEINENYKLHTIFENKVIQKYDEDYDEEISMITSMMIRY
jgi:hypothetical protein